MHHTSTAHTYAQTQPTYILTHTRTYIHTHILTHTHTHTHATTGEDLLDPERFGAMRDTLGGVSENVKFTQKARFAKLANMQKEMLAAVNAMSQQHDLALERGGGGPQEEVATTVSYAATSGSEEEYE